jgi:hypothetical protein
MQYTNVHSQSQIDDGNKLFNPFPFGVLERRRSFIHGWKMVALCTQWPTVREKVLYGGRHYYKTAHEVSLARPIVARHFAVKKCQRVLYVHSVSQSAPV